VLSVRADDVAAAPDDDVAVEPGLFGLEGRVGGDLATSIEATGAYPEVASAYLRLLRRHRIAIDSLGPADEFRLVVETNRHGAQRLVYAELLKRGSPPLRMLAAGETPRLGAPASRRVAAYRLPVFGRITSAFGNRLHPILGYVRPHRGIDIGAPAGTPITVAAPGRVMSAGWSGGYGNLVRIRHADGLVSSYAHMSAISVRVGSEVAAGQTIGRVGWTGLATGPHLHFELSRNGVALDPTLRRLSTILNVAPSKAVEQRYRRLRSWPMFHSISDAAARSAWTTTAS
jgi:murein DD-endopeptidase MepM/ murein hydrolase activator NlpD